MIFEEGKFYRHSRSMDVDIYVILIRKVDKKGTELRVAFMSRNPPRGLFSLDTITIKPEQYPNWIEVPE